MQNRGDKSMIRIKDTKKRWILKYERNYPLLNRKKEKKREMLRIKDGKEKMWNMQTNAKANYSSLNIREEFYIPVTQYIKLKNDSNRNWFQKPWKVVGVRMLGKLSVQLQRCKTVSGGNKGLSLTLQQTRRPRHFCPFKSDRRRQVFMKCGLRLRSEKLRLTTEHLYKVLSYVY